MGGAILAEGQVMGQHSGLRRARVLCVNFVPTP